MKLYMVICGEGRAEVMSGYPGPERGEGRVWTPGFEREAGEWTYGPKEGEEGWRLDSGLREEGWESGFFIPDRKMFMSLNSWLLERKD